jgi:hypothetical protein
MYPKMYPKFQEAAFRVDPGADGLTQERSGCFSPHSVNKTNDCSTSYATTATLRVSTPNPSIILPANQRVTKRPFRLHIVVKSREISSDVR